MGTVIFRAEEYLGVHGLPWETCMMIVMLASHGDGRLVAVAEGQTETTL